MHSICNNLFFLLLFIELPLHVVFPDLNLPKVGPHDVRFFDVIFLPVVLILANCCVTVPWVSEVEIEIAVTKTNCNC